MAVLSIPDRIKVWVRFMNRNSSDREEMAVDDKDDLQTAINSLDDKLDILMPAIFAAIPPAIQSVLTDKQQAEMVYYITQRKFELL